MAESASKILEGVFAISKPQSLSSAQVLRELQTAFYESKTFAPLLEDTRRKQEEQERHQSKRRRRGNDAPFKMGHGGTLDPLATGVLIVGIGRGTKYLQNFLTCTKTYDTVVLFGKSTDTYDVAGKIVAEAEYDHITRELVENKLSQFRGTIKQVPPVYSALRINGMRAYEYARAGKELPRELESREMQVDECTLLDWYEGGKHDFRWPAEHAQDEEKAALTKLMSAAGSSTTTTDEPPQVSKEESQNPSTSEPRTAEHSSTAAAASSSPQPQLEPKSQPIPANETSQTPPQKSHLHTHDPTLNLSSTASPAPAALIRLTVSSGFYVRSFAHDLGHSVSSLATMATLARTRQAHFTTTDPSPSTDLIPTLTYEEIQSGEETWGPKITKMLETWTAENPAGEAGKHVDGRDPDTRNKIADERSQKPRQRFRGGWTEDTKDGRKKQAGVWKGKYNEGGNRGKMHERGGRDGLDKRARERERNSSSDE